MKFSTAALTEPKTSKITKIQIIVKYEKQIGL